MAVTEVYRKEQEWMEREEEERGRRGNYKNEGDEWGWGGGVGER